MNPSFTPDSRQNLKSHCRRCSKTALYGSNSSRKRDKFYQSLMSAAALSPGSGCVGQESVTVHVLLCRTH